MAITIDYSDSATPQYVINVPRADMLDVTGGSPTEIRQLNINDFRAELGSIQAAAEGTPFPTAFEHTPPLTVAGVTLARVVVVLNPYVVLFEDGLYNVNVVGGNSNIGDVTVKNQVGLNTANSAGLQDPFALQAAAFGNTVSINQGAGLTGTGFPRGSPGYPVNNVNDAIAIAIERGLKHFTLQANATFTSGDFSSGYTFAGANPSITLTLDPGANVIGCVFENLTVQGTLDGGNTLRGCAVLDINYFNGFVFQCGMSGTITLGGTEEAIFIQCFSLFAGGGPGAFAVLDLGGAHVTPVVVRDWQGVLALSNMLSTSGAGISIDMSSGRLVVESDVTAGVVTLRGLCGRENNGGTVANGNGTFVLNDETESAKIDRMLNHAENSRVEITGRDFEGRHTSSVHTVFAEDGVTVVAEIDATSTYSTGTVSPGDPDTLTRVKR
jgi:hypothetical protein